MSLYIDRKYALLVSPKLQRFAQKKDYLWNFRCPDVHPFCGDSKKNKSKARAYLYRTKSNINFVCHNCNLSMSLGNFLKVIDHSLYMQYQMERYSKESCGNVAKPNFDLAKQKPVFREKPINLPSIDSLPPDHFARQYCEKRRLPRLDILYFASDFLSFLNQTFPSHEKNIPENDQRLVIPFFDQNKNLLGVQGRTLTNSKMRYITIKKDESCQKIYGLDRVDLSKPIYVVEGPLDSLFLPNCLATMDSNLSYIQDMIGDHDYIFVHDNEPRNTAIIQQLERSIETGHSVCVWPSNIVEKDINDMIISGKTQSEILQVLEQNTFKSLRAKLEFGRWRRL
jgi:hypothetical protein